MEESVSRKLRSEQSVYWTVSPNSYLKKVAGVVRCYERELAAKDAVLSFLQQVAEDLRDGGFAQSQELEDRLKVQLVVWMLEPELDLKG